MLKETKTTSEIKHTFIVDDGNGNRDENEFESYLSTFQSLLSRMTYKVHECVSDGYDIDGAKTYVFESTDRDGSSLYKRYCVDLFKVVYHEQDGTTVFHNMHIDLIADQKINGLWELVYTEDASK